ncbi:conserved hypothetical protein [delta proteobacterium NaphS2]|nr:conserved hypothetical protein [delta proteobacterium NaphS2]
MAICIFKWTESHLIYTKSEEIPSENDFFFNANLNRTSLANEN